MSAVTLSTRKSTVNDKYTVMSDRILYILRGLPGSGKSTLAYEIGKDAVVFSTDDFFMIDFEYRFDPTKLGCAHVWNQQRAKHAMANGESCIVIDNTNVELWEARPYVEAAVAFGYTVKVLEPRTPWRFDVPTLAARNAHGVSAAVIASMKARWERDFTVERVLGACRPVRVRLA